MARSFSADEIAADDAKYDQLREQLSRPEMIDNVSYIYEGRDVYQPEPDNRAEWEKVYENENVYSFLTPEEITAAGDDALFEYTEDGEDGPGFIVTRRGE